MAAPADVANANTNICPTFAGTPADTPTVAKIWLSCYQAFCTAKNINDHATQLFFALKGPAAIWLREWVDDRPPQAAPAAGAAAQPLFTFDQFRTDFEARYIKTLTATQRAQLMGSLAQGPHESVEDLFTRCKAAARTCTGECTEAAFTGLTAANRQLVHRHYILDKARDWFICGLRPQIRTLVQQNTSWTTLQQCVDVAVSIESSIRDNATGNSSNSNGSNSSNGSNNKAKNQQHSAKKSGPVAAVAHSRSLPAHAAGKSRQHRARDAAPPAPQQSAAPVAAAAPAADSDSDVDDDELWGAVIAALRGRRRSAPPRRRQPQAAPHPDQRNSHEVPITCHYCGGKFHIESTCMAKAQDQAKNFQ